MSKKRYIGTWYNTWSEGQNYTNWELPIYQLFLLLEEIANLQLPQNIRKSLLTKVSIVKVHVYDLEYITCIWLLPIL